MRAKLRNLNIVPEDVFVSFDGVSPLVRPSLEYPAEPAQEIPVLAGQNGLSQLYTNDIMTVYQKMAGGYKDGYSLLSDEQPLVKSGKMSKDSMMDILFKFGEDFFGERQIWCELLDLQPHRRRVGYTKGGDVSLLYRNWNVSGGNVRISGAEAVPIKWMKTSYYASREIREKLNATENTFVWVDRKYTINENNGLSSLYLYFGGRRPEMGSYRSIKIKYPHSCALLGKPDLK